MPTLSTSAKDNPSPTRRRVLIAATSAVAAIAASPIAAAPAAAPLNDVDRQAMALWERRDRLIAEWADAYARDKAARTQLPWWVKPGPRYLYADGSFGEEQSGWPANPDAKPPVAGRIDIRPSEGELRNSYLETHIFALESVRLAHDKACADLHARVEARDREYARLGLTESDEQLEQMHNAIATIEDELSDLDCEESLHAAAAMTLLMTREVLHVDADEFAPQPGVGLFLAMLRLLRPAIGGLIAEGIDRALAAADTFEDGAIIAAIDPRLAPEA